MTVLPAPVAQRDLAFLKQDFLKIDVQWVRVNVPYLYGLYEHSNGESDLFTKWVCKYAFPIRSNYC